MAKQEKKKYKHWIERFKNKYRLVIMQDDTFEEKLSFRLSRLNVFMFVSILAIILISATIYLIAYTPLKQYIPGYSDIQLREDLYKQIKRTDSLEAEIRSRDVYLTNLQNILSGNTKALRDTKVVSLDTLNKKSYQNIKFTHSKDDSLLRKKIEKLDKYNLVYSDKNKQNGVYKNKSSIRNFFFFTPLRGGQVTNGFKPDKNHYGIDVVGKENDAVKATLDGRVIFANWTMHTGYVIVLMHQSNMISVYKHNSSLLKKQGEIVKAGEPIAIFGNTGQYSSGPHLHFELWYNGNPINPRKYMSF